MDTCRVHDKPATAFRSTVGKPRARIETRRGNYATPASYSRQLRLHHGAPTCPRRHTAISRTRDEQMSVSPIVEQGLHEGLAGRGEWFQGLQRGKGELRIVPI